MRQALKNWNLIEPIRELVRINVPFLHRNAFCFQKLTEALDPLIYFVVLFMFNSFENFEKEMVQSELLIYTDFPSTIQYVELSKEE